MARRLIGYLAVTGADADDVAKREMLSELGLLDLTAEDIVALITGFGLLGNTLLRRWSLVAGRPTADLLAEVGRQFAAVEGRSGLH